MILRLTKLVLTPDPNAKAVDLAELRSNGVTSPSLVEAKINRMSENDNTVTRSAGMKDSGYVTDLIALDGGNK